MEPINIIGLLPLLRKVREVYPNKNIWCFTGYEFEKDILGKMMKSVEGTKEFISYIDVLVDGKYVEALHNVNLKFKGSSNQKTIMVQESLTSGKTVLWNPPEYIDVDVKTNKIGDAG